MSDHGIKTILIVLVAVALALGVLTTFVVFYPGGAYQTIVASNSFSTGASSTSTTPTSTTTTNVFASTTASNPPLPTSTPIAGQFSSEYSLPYPVIWGEGNEQFSVTGAAVTGNQLTLTLAIQMGSAAECVPLNIRLVADETGTLKVPDSPAGGSFAFPDTQSCNGTPGAIYSESVVWDITSIPSPFLLTTGGASNIFFSVATSTAGGVDITLPSHSG